MARFAHSQYFHLFLSMMNGKHYVRSSLVAHHRRGGIIEERKQLSSSTFKHDSADERKTPGAQLSISHHAPSRLEVHADGHSRAGRQTPNESPRAELVIQTGAYPLDPFNPQGIIGAGEASRIGPQAPLDTDRAQQDPRTRQTSASLTVER